MRKFYPKVGQVYKSRSELLDKLERFGWVFDGQSSSISKGKVTGQTLEVRDEKTDTWVVIEMDPVKQGVRITEVKKLKLSDFDSKKR